MKVIHINQSDYIGGAGRAAYRLHRSLRENGVNSFMWVNRATLGDWTVSGASSKVELALKLIRPSIVWPIKKLAKATQAPHSLNILPSHWVKKINQSDADIINLHWINGEMISIKELSQIKKPIVWTLHDMWAFCGAEHYSEENRWKLGYSSYTKKEGIKGFDLSKFVWNQKIRYWKKPLQIVAPSIWLADCVRSSHLMKGWPVNFIPNPIDTTKWKSIEMSTSRGILGLPNNRFLILFGAIGGSSDPRKGFDLLEGALKNLISRIELKDNIELVIFGQAEPKDSKDLGFKVHYVGHLHDDISMNILYSACDVFVLPSRQDNCPLTVLESQSSGTPVVAFNATGAPSVIKHKVSGYLAKAFDVEDFASGILWVFNAQKKSMSKLVSQFSHEMFDARKIAKKYELIYNQILKGVL